MFNLGSLGFKFELSFILCGPLFPVLLKITLQTKTFTFSNNPKKKIQPRSLEFNYSNGSQAAILAYKYIKE